MDEVFTLSGPDVSAPFYLGLPPPIDVECAQKVKTTLVIGAATTVSSIPVALFGAYKLMKGRGAAGITALLATGALWFIGRSLVVSSAKAFDTCRKGA
jgi:hypothetical protein